MNNEAGYLFVGERRKNDYTVSYQILVRLLELNC